MGNGIDSFLEHRVWRDTHLARLVPLADAAEELELDTGAILFSRFHPADRFYLLTDGAVAHEADRDDAPVPDAASIGDVSWRWAALGWSGFLAPKRYGTTARTIRATRLIGWRHDDLATCFYSDPELAVDFLRIVCDSIRRQYEAVRTGRIEAAARRRMPAVPASARPVRGGGGFVAGTVATLRRSAFFERFDDASLEALARDATLVHFDAGADIVNQDDETSGLRVLAGGTALSYFDDPAEPNAAPIRFRTFNSCGAVLSGVPSADSGYVAEATVVAGTDCSVYRIPGESIDALMRADPEFGRSYMQRSLARLANLLSAARVAGAGDGDEPEIAAVNALLEQTQARIPVNSELNKVPHLLSHRLTAGNAFSALNTVAETGRYQERSIARTCKDLLAGIRAEHRFYTDVLDAYVDVVEAPGDVAPERLRERCDRSLARAFGHLSTEVVGTAHLPGAGGNIVIMNHLSCPEHYEFPNGYHFSFDTAFTSVLLNRRYGHSPVRIVRQSPGAEYGHNLFYSRLGHITVPTIESGIADDSPESLAELRKESARLLFEAGAECLAEGRNLLVCPEGSSQRADDSPARFFSGAFRLALGVEPEPFIVPIALAGFDRRYRDSKLVAVINKPFRLSEAIEARGSADLREFLDGYRREFAVAVCEARALSTADTPARVA